MIRLETDYFHDFFDWFADLKGGVDAAEIVWAQLLEVEEVFNHECQEAFTGTVDVQRVAEFALNPFQSLFEAIRIEVFGANYLDEVTDLAHQHIHDKILRMNRI